ncbi:MAG: cytochrome o ubiquinol oxidase subunit I, partial [Alphaproteobacteria bacterium]
YQRPDKYEDIVLPKNSFIGAVIGGAGFVFGFAMVWWIWWLAFLSLLVMFVAIVIRASDDDSDYVMSASEVRANEDARFAQLAKAPKNEMEDDPGFAGQPVPEAT